MPPHFPCAFNNSRIAIAAPWRTSHAALNRSTSNTLVIPSQTQKPDSTSSALDSFVALGDIAPPLEGSMVTLSLAEAGDGLDNLEFEATFSSALTNRALHKV